MIPPQELKKKDFAKGMRGYDPTDVDEYIDFLIDKYTELFAQCDEYQGKLRQVRDRLSEIQSEEEAIRALAISTQKQCDNMTEEAKSTADKIIQEAYEKAQAMITAGEEKEKSILMNAKQIAESTLVAISEKAEEQIRSTNEKSAALLLSARTRCAKILNYFKKEINLQRTGLLQMKAAAENFNDMLFNMYKEHINSLSNTPEINIDLDELTESKLLDSIMQDIKNDAMHIADKNSDKEYDFQVELNILQKEIENISNIDYNYTVAENDAGAQDTNEDDTDEEIGKTTVFTKVTEAKLMENAKIYAEQNNDESESDDGNTVVFDKSMLNNINPDNTEQGQYQEELIEEYDGDNLNENNYDAAYSYENHENLQESSLSDSYDDESPDNSGDDDDDYEEYDDSVKKGFLGGLFGKKKNNKKNKKANDDDDDDVDMSKYDIDDDAEYDIDDDDL